MRRGDEAQRARARRSLRLAQQFRQSRSMESRTGRLLGRNMQAQWWNIIKPMGASVLECEKERRIYDAQNSQRLPGLLMRSEGAAQTGDPAVNEAYDGMGATFDLYGEYNRCSIDDHGMPLIGTVHYGQDFDNAGWNGSQMIFGDGDGFLTNRFTIAVDIMGHELTHGVVDHTAQLVYMFQPGALNEHIADVFGSIVKQRELGRQQAADADWLIGEGLFTENVNGRALRSMKEPGTAYDDPIIGKDPQPGHMRDFVRLRFSDDNGGVHINSGIPNRAFYLAAVGIGGFSGERAGRIWYEALTSPTLSPFARFQQFAQETIMAAIDLFGRDSTEHRAVREAWAEVGITVAGVWAWRVAA